MEVGGRHLTNSIFLNASAISVIPIDFISIVIKPLAYLSMLDFGTGTNQYSMWRNYLAHVESVPVGARTCDFSVISQALCPLKHATPYLQ